MKTPQDRTLGIRTAAAAALMFTLCLAGRPAAAQDQPAPAGEQEIVITATQGLVQVRENEEQPWRPATVGERLPIGGEFRTGPRSAVRFSVGDDQTVTLDRLGTVKVLDAVRTAGVARTEVGMKYGRSTMQVEAAGIEHESTIRTPSATLAIRGSIGSLTEYVNTLVAMAQEGVVGWTNAKGRYVPLPPGAHQEGDQTSTAQGNANTGTFNPLGNSTTSEETTLLSQNPNGFFASSQTGTDSARGSLTAPVVMETGPFQIPDFDGLVFAVQWLPVGGDLADLDVFVRDPLERTVGAFIGSSQVFNPDAFATGDDTGQNGFEAIVYPNEIPPGIFEVGVDHFSGPTSEYQLDIFKNRQPKIPSINGQVGPGQQDNHFFDIDAQGNVSQPD